MVDHDVKVCFISAAYIDFEKMRERKSIIQKPVEIDDLIRRVKAELV
jgi:hypothetical protein